VIDDPPPRPNAKAFTGAAPSRSPTTSTSPDHVEKRMMGRLDFGRQPEPDV